MPWMNGSRNTILVSCSPSSFWFATQYAFVSGISIIFQDQKARQTSQWTTSNEGRSAIKTMPSHGYSRALMVFTDVANKVRDNIRLLGICVTLD